MCCSGSDTAAHCTYVCVCVCVCVLCVCAEVCTALCVCVCGNINLLQEKLIEDLRISARKNGLAISKSAFNRVTKRGLKCHPFKMHARKEIIINEIEKK